MREIVETIPTGDPGKVIYSYMIDLPADRPKSFGKVEHIELCAYPSHPDHWFPDRMVPPSRYLMMRGPVADRTNPDKQSWRVRSSENSQAFAQFSKYARFVHPELAAAWLDVSRDRLPRPALVRFAGDSKTYAHPVYGIYASEDWTERGVVHRRLKMLPFESET